MTKKTDPATVAAGSPEWVPCQNCRKDFQVRPNLPGRRKRYCSTACRTQAFRAARAPRDDQRREELVAALVVLRAVDLAAIRTRLSLLDGDALAELARYTARLGAAVLPPEPATPAAAGADPLAQEPLPLSVTPGARPSPRPRVHS